MALVPLVVIAVVVVTSWSCGASSQIDRGRAAALNSEWEEALRYYERACAEDPDNVEYRIALAWARLDASRSRLARARALVASGDPQGGIDEFEAALGYDPSNRYAQEELEELRTRLPQKHAPISRAQAFRFTPFVEGEPELDPSSPELLHVKFPDGSSLRDVLESLAKLAGVSILFDESFRDQRVSVDLEQVTYREALDILMQTNGLFYKVVTSSSPVLPRDHPP